MLNVKLASNAQNQIERKENRFLNISYASSNFALFDNIVLGMFEIFESNLIL